MSRSITKYISSEGIRVIASNAQKIIVNNLGGMSIIFRPFPSPKPIAILIFKNEDPSRLFLSPDHLSYPQLSQ